MGTLAIRIDTDNAAFEDDDLGPELARMLRDLADSIEGESRAALSDAWVYRMRDVNGNTTGRATFEPGEAAS